MAYLRMREGRDFEIEGLIKSKTEQNRDSFAFNVLLAQSYFKQGKLAEASALYKALIETDPKLSLGYSLAGEIDRQQNRAEVAMQNFQKALELNPMDITALRGLSQLGRGDRVNALLLQSLIPF
jgi:tetratricopeptide (TPR) repeat protein